MLDWLRATLWCNVVFSILSVVLSCAGSEAKGVWIEAKSPLKLCFAGWEKQKQNWEGFVCLHGAIKQWGIVINAFGSDLASFLFLILTTLIIVLMGWWWNLCKYSNQSNDFSRKSIFKIIAIKYRLLYLNSTKAFTPTVG